MFKQEGCQRTMVAHHLTMVATSSCTLRLRVPDTPERSLNYASFKFKQGYMEESTTSLDACRQCYISGVLVSAHAFLSRTTWLYLSLQTLVLKDITEAVMVSDLVAPEHLEIQTENSQEVADRCASRSLSSPSADRAC